MDEEQIKLQCVLSNILTPTFKIDDFHLQQIINNVKQEATITHTFTKNTSIYSKWIERVLLLWENKKKPSKKSLLFFLELITEFSNNKINFLLLHQSNVFIKTINVLKTSNATEDFELLESYLKMLTSFMYTDFGRNWLATSLNYWKHIFEVISKQLFTKEISTFLANLYLHILPDNELFMVDLSHILLQPFVNINGKIHTGNINGINEVELFEELCPTLRISYEIILCACDKIEHISQWTLINNKFLSYQKLLNNLLQVVKGEQFTLELSKALISMHFLEAKDYIKCPLDFAKSFKNVLVKLLHTNINRQYKGNVLELCYVGIIYWNHISKIVDVSSLKFCFQTELLIIQFMPIGSLIKQIFGKELMKKIKENDVRAHYIDRLWSLVDVDIVDLIYRFRNLIFKNRSDVEEALLPIEYMSKSRHMYNKECSITLFKYFVYLMEDFALDISNNHGISSTIYNEAFFNSILDSFTTLVQEINVSWKDGIETTQVLTIITDLLNVTELPTEIVVKLLILVELSIIKYMEPSLALLIESKDSSMTCIGGLLYSKLHDEHIDVRRKSLEVLQTILEKAKVKYPYFQKMILESDLHTLLLDVTFSNDATEIRINGLKCMEQLVPLTSIWSELLLASEVLDQLINLLKTESSSSVRSECVNLISIIYEEDYFSDDQVKELYSIMSHLGVYDHDINVRINILNFWDKVIKKHLQEEGMIDNAFPEVTFSKNSRKIVVLDEEEIIRRLRRVMNYLSYIRCLTVLTMISTSTEETERSIVKKIINELLAILEKYNITLFNIEIDEKYMKNNASCGADSDSIVSPQKFIANALDLNNEVCSNSSLEMPTFSSILEEILVKNRDMMVE